MNTKIRILNDIEQVTIPDTVEIICKFAFFENKHLIKKGSIHRHYKDIRK